MAKVSGKLCRVRLLRESRFGGWDAENIETRRAVRIRTAGRLRRVVDQATVNDAMLKLKERRAAGQMVVGGDGESCGPSTAERIHAQATTPARDAYLDSLPPDRRAMALEARAKHLAPVPLVVQPGATVPKGLLDTVREVGKVLGVVDQEMRKSSVCGKCGKPTSGIVLAGQTKVSSGMCVCPPAEEISCYLCGKPVRREDAQNICNGTYRHKDCDPCAKERAEAHKEEGEVMASKKSGKVSHKAAAGATVAAGQKSTSKGTKAGPERNVAHVGAPQAKGSGKTSLLDAAILVMKAAGKPMNCKDVVHAILEKKLWGTTGKTPASTLYSSVLREIQKKGSESRFKKVDRGQFTLKG
jgi:hypothetical protein